MTIYVTFFAGDVTVRFRNAQFVALVQLMGTAMIDTLE